MANTDFDAVRPQTTETLNVPAMLEPYETATEAAMKLRSLVERYNTATPVMRARINIVLTLIGQTNLTALPEGIASNLGTWFGLENALDYFQSNMIEPEMTAEGLYDQAVVEATVKAAIETYRNGGEVTLEGIAPSLRERIRAGVEDALVGRPLSGNHGNFVATAHTQLVPASDLGNREGV